MSQQLFKAYFQSISHTFKDLPKGNFYWRFFKRDLGRIINMPCPVDSPNQEADIVIFKELRAQIGISEENVCSNCPFNAKCVKAFQQFDTGNMQNLLLPNLSRFLEQISLYNLNIQNLDDSKSFWLASNRILDTFHAILIDFQKNQNQINQLFLQDQQNDSDVDTNKYSKQTQKSEKYYRAADFLNENQNNEQPSEEHEKVSSKYENIKPKNSFKDNQKFNKKKITMKERNLRVKDNIENMIITKIIQIRQDQKIKRRSLLIKRHKRKRRQSKQKMKNRLKKI
ncbi:unnamed protein product (macronuclear) [Paramecium tetraurelia]|uniref:Uncharacterized protein n=1 Tax=Paramecium tetraurelia TaxID=5888 RepID=A0CNC2_PARTE|nr:uncharacterized protein GSPATT00008731001 [Paramecium tetraurelia]CAK72289.1 unnamed protein product [Paramecium tetraurelia]|eukprot:XP_001439686.1 hypothetical protein (macronuclear) [Paramecium tetraurelia strain d4-2]